MSAAPELAPARPPPGRRGGFRAFARDPLGFLEGLARERFEIGRAHPLREYPG